MRLAALILAQIVMLGTGAGQGGINCPKSLKQWAAVVSACLEPRVAWIGT